MYRHVPPYGCCTTKELQLELKRPGEISDEISCEIPKLPDALPDCFRMLPEPRPKMFKKSQLLPDKGWGFEPDLIYKTLNTWQEIATKSVARVALFCTAN